VEQDGKTISVISLNREMQGYGSYCIGVKDEMRLPYRSLIRPATFALYPENIDSWSSRTCLDNGNKGFLRGKRRNSDCRRKASPSPSGMQKSVAAFVAVRLNLVAFHNRLRNVREANDLLQFESISYCDA
jgi:hypothetical protein